jgi:hypothetical protein
MAQLAASTEAVAVQSDAMSTRSTPESVRLLRA